MATAGPAVLLALCLASASCATSTPKQVSAIQINQSSYLGETNGIDYLARAFLVSGQNDVQGFGFYVYLVFQPEATREQRLRAAKAFLARPEEKHFRALRPDDPRRRYALLVAPVQHSGLPTQADQLVADYDSARSAIIARAVERTGKRVPAVALVANPTPIEQDGRLDKAQVSVRDACGDAEDVDAKFIGLREALVTEESEGRVLLFAEIIGRLFIRFSTVPCR
jgi:hypothetical protein